MASMQASLLEEAVAGDATAMGEIGSAAHADVLHAGVGLRLVVTRRAVARVLTALLDRAIDPEIAQRWASFIKRGIAAGGSGAVRPLDIEWEDEDLLAEVLGRLDELGDLIDGEMSDAELRQWLGRLETADK
jgi:hypothetical protein